MKSHQTHAHMVLIAYRAHHSFMYSLTVMHAIHLALSFGHWIFNQTYILSDSMKLKMKNSFLNFLNLIIAAVFFFNLIKLNKMKIGNREETTKESFSI